MFRPFSVARRIASSSRVCIAAPAPARSRALSGVSSTGPGNASRDPGYKGEKPPKMTGLTGNSAEPDPNSQEGKEGKESDFEADIKNDEGSRDAANAKAVNAQNANH